MLLRNPSEVLNMSYVVIVVIEGSVPGQLGTFNLQISSGFGFFENRLSCSCSNSGHSQIPHSQ